MKIIVTGGAGFIGSAFVNLSKEFCPTAEIIVIDKFTYAANRDNVKTDCQIIEKDINDVTLSDIDGCDYIVNFAAESHVDNSIENGLPFIKSNVQGVYNLLEVAKNITSLKKFVQISTDEVYGDMHDHYERSRILNMSAAEDHPLNPSSYYSSTKAAADLLVQSAHRTFGLPYLITRTCNNFGAHQHSEKFLSKIHKMIKSDEAVPVYGDGEQLREWIWVDDNARILWELILSDNAINQVYNIGSGIRYKNIELINMISEAVGKSVKFKYVKDRLGHDRAYRLRCDELRKFHNLDKLKPLPYNFLHIKDYIKDHYGSLNN